MVERASQLGVGAYTVAEVARLVQMPYSTARAWYLGPSGSQDHLLHSDYSKIDGDFAVSFLDLIDANAVRQFRSVKVSFQVIRRSYEILASKLKTKHPFAHSDLYTDGKRILVDISSDVGDSALTDVINRQGFFYEMKDILKKIKYDPITKLAARWPIYDDVLIDPAISYGKPAIVGTATRTSVIARQYAANDNNAGLVADLFSISESQVLNAVRFEQLLGNRKAA